GIIVTHSIYQHIPLLTQIETYPFTVFFVILYAQDNTTIAV
ncbi:unnamed protein product, partial [marine sediment metagenome]